MKYKVERERALLRYKYSKYLRRRALWARDPTIDALKTNRAAHIPPTWMGRSKLDIDNDPLLKSAFDSKLTSEDPKSQEEEEFLRFKEEVDKDPFGVLFGRRLERLSSPPSTSGWTSLSWLFSRSPETPDSSNEATSKLSNETTPNANAAQKPLQNPEPVKNSVQSYTPLSDSTRNARETTKAAAAPSDIYEYDAISGRKVLKANPATSAPEATKATKSLFETLLGEHEAVDIPVKKYKPHPVYGNSDTAASNSNGESNANSPAPKPLKMSENSRQRELLNLKSVTLGTNIDTSAEYHGKLPSPPESKPVDTDESQLRSDETLASDNKPLFSGTTYESRSPDITNRSRSNVSSRSKGIPQAGSWLMKEGFGISKPVAQVNSSPSPPAPIAGRIELAFDRMQAAERHSDVSIKPPIDRMHAAKETEQSREEDLDLLRASDLRAAMKSTRKTRREMQKSKEDKRRDLEHDFEATSRTSTDVYEGNAKLSESLNRLWDKVSEPFSSTSQMPSDTVDPRPSYRYTNLKAVAASDDITSSLPLSGEDSTIPSAEKAIDKRAETAIKRVSKGNDDETFQQEAAKGSRNTQAANDIRKAYEDKYGLTVATRLHPKRAVDAVASTPPDPQPTSALSVPAIATAPEHVKRVATPPRIRKAEDMLVPWTSTFSTVPCTVQLNSLLVTNLTEPENTVPFRTIDNSHIQSSLKEGWKSMKVPKIKPQPAAVEELKEELTQTPDLDKVPLGGSSVGISPAVLAMESAASNVWVHKLGNAFKESKKNRAALHEVAQHLKALQSNRPLTPWNTISEQPAQSPVTELECEPSPAMVDKPLAASAAMTADLPTPPASPKSATSTSSAEVAIFKVLAYDSSTLTVCEATTTGTSNDDTEPMHPTEVLSRLNSPAKFLPYFQRMQDEGFEIVRGGGDMLVFRKVRDGVTSAPVATSTEMPKIAEDSLLEQKPMLENETTAAKAAAQEEKISPDVAEALAALGGLPAENIEPKPKASSATTPTPAKPAAPPLPSAPETQNQTSRPVSPLADSNFTQEQLASIVRPREHEIVQEAAAAANEDWRSSRKAARRAERKARKDVTIVRRQEPVFSGTSTSMSAKVPGPAAAVAVDAIAASSSSSSSSGSPGPAVDTDAAAAPKQKVEPKPKRGLLSRITFVFKVLAGALFLLGLVYAGECVEDAITEDLRMAKERKRGQQPRVEVVGDGERDGLGRRKYTMGRPGIVSTMSTRD